MYITFVALTLSQRMGPLHILLCLTPDDFTCQYEKSCNERIKYYLFNPFQTYSMGPFHILLVNVKSLVMKVNYNDNYCML